jgi:N-glycosylase/DNA lyase
MKSLYEIHTEGTVQINDDFDLQKIAASGQVFRASQISEAGEFKFVHGENVLFIQKIDNPCAIDGAAAPQDAGLSGGAFRISCDSKTWEGVWAPYFDLQRSYCDIRERAAKASEFIDTTMDFGCGLRILKQNPWEMLVTFIISQRKSMPAIASAVDTLCKRFGQPIAAKCTSNLFDSYFVEDVSHLSKETTARDAAYLASMPVASSTTDAGSALNPKDTVVFAFPTPEALAAATQEELRACSLGYRAPYVADAARRVVSGELDLERAAKMDDQALFEYLQTVHGVGKKVANCVCLFGFGRTSLVPVDVWIARAIDTHCGGDDPFAQFGQDAGVIQQYVFYYMTQTRNKNI